MSYLIFFCIHICFIQFTTSQRVSTTTVVNNGLQYNPNSVVGTVRPSVPRMVPDLSTRQAGVGSLGPNQVINQIRPNQQGVAYGGNVQGLGPLSRNQAPNTYGLNQRLNTLGLNQGINAFGSNQVPTQFGPYQGFNANNQGFGPYGQVSNVGAYGGAGNGNVEVNGDLPVTGNAAVTGRVPLTGKVSFTGDVPCGGVVTISGSCPCNPPNNQPVYGNRPYRRI